MHIIITVWLVGSTSHPIRKWNIFMRNALHRYCHNYHHGLWLESQQVNQIRTNIKLSLSHFLLKIIIRFSAHNHHLYPTPCSLSISLSFLFCSLSLKISHILLVGARSPHTSSSVHWGWVNSASQLGFPENWKKWVKIWKLNLWKLMLE